MIIKKLFILVNKFSFIYLFTSTNSKITTSVSNTYIFHNVENIAPG